MQRLDGLLSGTKVNLRPIEERDTENIVRWRNKESVKSALFSQDDLTIDQHRWWLQNKVQTGLCAQFIIEAVQTGHAVGTVFIKNMERAHKKGEFGIFIGEDEARSMGFGSEATRLILAFAFGALALNRVYLSVFSDNPFAIRSYEKAGFAHEGLLKQDILHPGGFRDVLLMAILSEEFNKKA